MAYPNMRRRSSGSTIYDKHYYHQEHNRVDTLRHTHASRLIQNGLSVYEVKEILVKQINDLRDKSKNYRKNQNCCKKLY